jgi:N-acyl-phosphatidylethanolamine-hydrolysing phospholipase D
MKSKPIPSTDRGPTELACLIQQRVKERDDWLVDGQPQEKKSHAQEFGQFFSDVFPKYVRFTPPTQEYLDEHFPVEHVDHAKWELLRNPPVELIQVTWMGHATILVQVNGVTILTDPVFSQRCSATQWSGPKRIRAPPCSIADLCQHLLVDVVVISHNHYDHLDLYSARTIHKCSPATTFVVPLGLKAWFHNNVSKQAVVHELDWDEYFDYNYSPTAGRGRQTLRITSVPMRHWSSRMGTDRDKTLWCGYSLATHTHEESYPAKKILFSGDTAWFDAMEDVVGKPYGPFDVAAIPIGAYEPREFMKRNHVNVDEAVRMKDACRAIHAVPIHWGTFPLTVEPVLEPQEKLQQLMKARDDVGTFESWRIGETKQFAAASGTV